MRGVEPRKPRWFTSSAVAVIGEVLLIAVVVVAIVLTAVIGKGGLP